MKEIKKHLLLFTCIFFMLTIGIISIYSASSLIGSSYNNLYLKQILWIVIGIILSIIVFFIKKEKIYKYTEVLYIIGIILLLLVLIFGRDINGSKAWIIFGGITIQPTEFMKIPLILMISKVLDKYSFEEVTMKKEFKVLLKIFVVTLIPSILAFIEPDTGSVISYFLILISILLISKIRKRWYLILGSIVCFILTIFILTYVYKPEVFVSTLGSDFFYRMHRLLDWSSGSGMQLENSLIAISTGNILGTGFNNTNIYIPEPQTDFIFSIFTNNYGLLGALSLLLVILIFSIKLIDNTIKKTRTFDKYVCTGVFTTFIFSFIVNISMTLGLLPIMGIPLPFISYGGSNLIVSLIMTSLLVKND